jgi:low affinity Fe/Cu permease
MARKRVTKSNNFSDRFTFFARHIAAVAGSPWIFMLALLAIIVWGALGPRYGYSDTWQMIINTGTTIVTFLMVFIIQNTENRDSKSIELKLDELLKREPSEESNAYIKVEDLSEEEIELLSKRFDNVKCKPKKK